MKLTYYLDGQEMAPEDLKGKSGHLEIHVEYENNEKQNMTINGKEETIYSPFVMVTGMILPGDTFKNVTIDNGKVVSDGNREIVIGFGMPGMQESLNLAQLQDMIDDLKETETETETDTRSETDTKEKAETETETETETVAETETEADTKEDDELNLPESFTVSADVENFSMSSTFTVALTDILKQLNTDKITNIDDLKDSLNDLEDAALKLVDGTSDLYDGVEELDDKYGEFDDGVKDLKEGVEKLVDGSSDLKDGAGSLKDGAGDLVDGVGTLKDGSSQLVSGASSLKDGTATLKNGASSLVSGAKQVDDGTFSLAAGAGELKNGSTTLKAGVDQYTSGADELNSGIQTYLGTKGALSGKVGEFQKGIATLSSGVKAYTKGASDLADGITAYVAGENEMATKAQGLKPLVTGLPKIRTSLNKLYQSVDGKGDKDLLAGAKTLAGGLAQLEAEIEGTDVTSLIQLVDSMIASGKELISEAGTMQGILNDEISGPMTEMLTTGAKLQQGVSDLSEQAGRLQETGSDTEGYGE